MNDNQVLETIHGCFEEMVVVINGRLDRMQTELREGLRKELQTELGKQEKRFDKIDARLDGMDARFDGIDKRLDGMDERFDRMDKRLDGMDERFDRMDKRLDRVDERLDDMDTQMKSMEMRLQERIDRVDGRVSDLAFYVENVTDKSIRILAENHIELTNKLAAGIEAAENNRMYAIQVGYLIENVDRMRREIDLMKLEKHSVKKTGKR